MLWGLLDKNGLCASCEYNSNKLLIIILKRLIKQIQLLKCFINEIMYCQVLWSFIFQRKKELNSWLWIQLEACR